jgi:hypothetical protein
VAIIEEVEVENIDEWWGLAFSELYAQLRSTGVAPSGPSGALYANELSEEERGEVVAFVPVTDRVEVSGRTPPSRSRRPSWRLPSTGVPSVRSTRPMAASGPTSPSGSWA